MGLVETGNLVSPGLCFSEKYAQEVGLKKEKLRPLSIGTAATGSTMALVGAVRNLRLKIGKEEVFHPISWVIRDLTSIMNIGYMFLRTHKLSVMLDGKEPVLHQRGNIELVQILAPGKSGLFLMILLPLS